MKNLLASGSINAFILLILLVQCAPSVAGEYTDVAIESYKRGDYGRCINELKEASRFESVNNSADWQFYYAMAELKLGNATSASYFYDTFFKSRNDHYARALENALAEAERPVLSVQASQNKGGKLGEIGVHLNGNRVTRVRPESPAAKAGITSGDIIQSIDGQPTKELSTYDVTCRLRKLIGQSVSLIILRGDKLYSAKAVSLEPTSYSVRLVDIPSAPSEALTGSQGSSDAGHPNTYNQAVEKFIVGPNGGEPNKSSPIYANVERALSSIPQKVRAALERDGYKLVLTPKTSAAIGAPDTLPDDITEVDSPRGWFSGTKRIFIPETSLSPGTGYVSNSFVRSTVRHEMGHAYDHYLGAVYSFPHHFYSSSSDFTKAFSQDRDEMPPARQQDWPFYNLDSVRSKREFIAELFTAICTPPDDMGMPRQLLLNSFPHTRSFLEQSMRGNLTPAK